MPESGIAPLEVAFDGTASTAPEGLWLVDYQWDPGDGSAYLTGETAVHTFLLPGERTVGLRVTDQLSIVDSAETTVTVTDVHGNVPPSARIVATVTDGPAELLVGFECDCAVGSAPIIAYRWDFADGAKSTGATTEHTFAEGRYRVWLTVVDQYGLGALDSQEIVVRRADRPELEPPSCKASADPVAGVAPLSAAHIGESWDLDGQVEEVGWVFADDTRSDQAVVIKEYNLPGVYPAVFTAADSDGLSCHDTVRVTVTTQDGAVPPEIVSIAGTQAECRLPYSYDLDDKPTAIGTPPIQWSLGQDGLGTPQGMQIDPGQGTISWVPSTDQAGENLVALVASNNAGDDVQLFNVEVTCQEEDSPDGCGCAIKGSIESKGWIISLFLVFAALLLLGHRRGY
jgi:PKD repeat protein